MPQGHIKKWVGADLSWRLPHLISLYIITQFFSCLFATQKKNHVYNIIENTKFFLVYSNNFFTLPFSDELRTVIKNVKFIST